MNVETLLAVPEHRRGPLREIAHRLLTARRVVLTTHVNADGDGAGCEAAVAAWLEEQGVCATIVNPTPFPEPYRFLLHRPDVVAEWDGGEGERAVLEADLVLVVDTSEPKRIGPLADLIDADRTIVLDHHPPGRQAVGRMGVQDATAAAAGELVYDLVSTAGGPWLPSVVQGIYVALVTDTGSFRFQNSSPRAHRIAADLLERGIDPEAMYRTLFATVPPRRLHLLRDVLGTLRTDTDSRISWLSVSQDMIRESRATDEDLDGLAEYARSIEGTEVAAVFRETEDGETKISFRSNGNADVNAIARRFGGGGHVKAAGAVVAAPPATVIPRVLDAVREALRGQPVSPSSR